MTAEEITKLVDETQIFDERGKPTPGCQAAAEKLWPLLTTEEVDLIGQSFRGWFHDSFSLRFNVSTLTSVKLTRIIQVATGGR